MKWGKEDFFLLIQTLPTFWAERIWILRIFIFENFGIPNFWISRFQISRIWPLAGLGPSGPARALLRGGSAVAPRHSRTTKCRRSKELGQYRENPISASPVWGISYSNLDFPRWLIVIGDTVGFHRRPLALAFFIHSS